jgi:hypothetical protein
VTDLSVAIRESITRPLYLVKMGFNTPVRLSSRETQTWDGFTWLEAGIEVTISESPTLKIFNENTLFGQAVLSDGTAGRSVEIYQAYGLSSGYTTPVLKFIGEMGQATIGEQVLIKCKRSAPNRTPRHSASPPTFMHLPKSGTRIETPKQTVVLE